MKCEQASQLISLSCEQKLTFKDKTQLQLHLWFCPKCRRFKQNNEKLSAMMRAYAKGFEE